MKPANPRILTVNGGSSSIKFAMFEAGDALRRILEGAVDRIGLPETILRVKGVSPADNFARAVTAPGHTVAVGVLMDWIEERCGRDGLKAKRTCPKSWARTPRLCVRLSANIFSSRFSGPAPNRWRVRTRAAWRRCSAPIRTSTTCWRSFMAPSTSCARAASTKRFFDAVSGFEALVGSR